MRWLTFAEYSTRLRTLPLPYAVSTIEAVRAVINQRDVVLRFANQYGSQRRYLFERGETVSPKLRRQLRDEGAI